MSAAKTHTPGEWTQSDSNPLYVFKDAQGVIDINNPIAVCHKESDARFISSAPDMLKTLDNARHWISCCIGECGSDELIAEIDKVILMATRKKYRRKK